MPGIQENVLIPPRALATPSGAASTPALLPAFGIAVLLHLSLLPLAIVQPPAPAPLPATALDILILRAATPATAPPNAQAEAALSQQNRIGVSSRGNAAWSDAADDTAPPLASPEPPPTAEPDLQPAPEPEPATVEETVAPEPAPPPPEPPPAPLVTEHASAVTLPSTPPARPAVAAVDILASRDREIARLTDRLEQRSAAYAARERRRSVSASTREFRYASYLESWARKIERIGNINYPAAARERRIHGSLILHVSVRSDGSVERTRIVRSSGHDLLDEAALRIVELAAPFSPFPPDIAAETDVLDIVRTWRFERGGRLGWE